jgi:hypothetical protein
MIKRGKRNVTPQRALFSEGEAETTYTPNLGREWRMGRCRECRRSYSFRKEHRPYGCLACGGPLDRTRWGWSAFTVLGAEHVEPSRALHEAWRAAHGMRPLDEMLPPSRLDRAAALAQAEGISIAQAWVRIGA